MEHCVKMPELPTGVAFPDDLAGRVRHDPEKGRLVFDGFMSKADFDRLCRLSDDWSYRRPLEDLFRLCTSEPQRTSVLSRFASAWSALGF